MRHQRSADRPGPQQDSWWKGSGMFQTSSTERRVAGGDRPRSGGRLKMRPEPPKRASQGSVDRASLAQQPGFGRDNPRQEFAQPAQRSSVLVLRDRMID